MGIRTKKQEDNMPKVPQYNRQVDVRPPGVSVPTFSAPPQAAFGENVDKANEKLFATIQGLGEKFAAHAIEIKEQNDQKRALDTELSFRKDMQSLLYSNDTDENGVSSGVLNRQLDKASGATIYFDAKYGDIFKKYSESLDNDRQKTMFNKLAESHYATEREGVIRHEATQMRESYRNSLEANITQRVNDAARYSEPKDVLKAIGESVSVLDSGMKKMGADDATITQKKQDLAGNIVKNSVSALLDNDFAKAKSVFDAAKPYINSDTAADIEKTLKGKQMLVNAQTAWDKMKGFSLSDGLPDVSKMEKTVSGMGLQPEEEEKMLDYVRAKAGERARNINQKRDANDRAFFNEAIGAKKNNIEIEDALKLAGRFGFDNYDIAQKEDAIRKIYTKDAETNPEIYMSLWEGVQDRSVTKEDIDTAKTKGRISVADWQGLRKEYYKSQFDTNDPRVKQAYERVKLLADEKLPQKKEKAAFLYDVSVETAGMKPEEIIATANEKLKNVSGSTIAAIPFFGTWRRSTVAYKNDIKKRDEEMNKLGQLSLSIGDDVVDGIGTGLVMAGKERSSESIAEFVQAYATKDDTTGLQTFIQDTPVSRAARTLRKNGKLINHDTIKRFLEKYPTGDIE
jgi:hypothetical protein